MNPLSRARRPDAVRRAGAHRASPPRPFRRQRLRREREQQPEPRERKRSAEPRSSVASDEPIEPNAPANGSSPCRSCSGEQRPRAGSHRCTCEREPGREIGERRLSRADVARADRLGQRPEAGLGIPPPRPYASASRRGGHAPAGRPRPDSEVARAHVRAELLRDFRRRVLRGSRRRVRMSVSQSEADMRLPPTLWTVAGLDSLTSRWPAPDSAPPALHTLRGRERASAAATLRRALTARARARKPAAASVRADRPRRDPGPFFRQPLPPGGNLPALRGAWRGLRARRRGAAHGHPPRECFLMRAKAIPASTRRASWRPRRRAPRPSPRAPAGRGSSRVAARASLLNCADGIS